MELHGVDSEKDWTSESSIQFEYEYSYWNGNVTASESSFGDINFNSTVNPIKIVLITLVSLMCIILNCGTLLVIFQHKRIRPVNYLIANLSVISIVSAVTVNLYIGEVYNGWLCGVLSYLRNLSVSVMSLTVLGISNDRLRSLKPHSAKLLIPRTLLCIWGFSIFLNIPTFFTNVTIESTEKHLSLCKKVPLLGIVAVNIAHEVFRFLVFHVAVCVYMIFELYKIRSKLKYIYLFKKIPSRKLRRKVQRVRFIYIYSSTFILIWLPLGVIVSFYKSYKAHSSSVTKYPILQGIAVTFLYIYILISPVVMLWTNEDFSKINWFWNYRKNCIRSPKDKVSFEKSEMSLQPTIAKTSDTQAILSRAQQVVCNIIVVIDEPQESIENCNAVSDGNKLSSIVHV